MPIHYSEGVSSVNRDREDTTPLNKTILAKKSKCPDIATPLVNSSISQRPLRPTRSNIFFNNFNEFVVYRRDLKIIKNFKCSNSSKASSNKRKIDKFSSSSRRSLRHVAANCSPGIKSQILLTFHKSTPTDGVTVKKLLNSLLTRLRDKVGCKYLWVMEFTRKGNPHIHVYLTCNNTSDIHNYLANTWNRICGESSEHLSVHLHNKNMIPWDMGSGAYVCKYLEKHYQKNVPDSFESVGRFWGCSRGFVKPISTKSVDDINNEIQPQIDLKTGELPQNYHSLKFIYRTLRKYQESRVRYATRAVTGKPRKFRSGITKLTGSTLPNGAIIYRQTMEYLQCQNPSLPF